MTRPRAFKQVDVFTAVPFKGNPVAVILDGEGLTSEAMQAIANWTNLSETTFVTPAHAPGADYAVRIFTPRCELPFAGHPTLGTAHAVIEAGLVTPVAGQVVQQCAAGLVTVSQSAAGLSFQLPRYALADAPDVEALEAALGKGAMAAAPMIVDVGPKWVVARLGGMAALEGLAPDLARLAAYDRAHATTGLTVYATAADGTAHVRSFAPADGIAEDPVCGSGNAAVAAYRLHHREIDGASRYAASQGRQIGRDGRIDVRIEGEAIHVGGACVTVIDGVFRAE